MGGETMSGFELEFPDDMFDSLMSIDDVAADMLKAGAVPLKEEMQDMIHKTFNDESTGELVDSITIYSPSIKGGESSILVAPKGNSKKHRHNGRTETRKKPLSNAAKLAIGEYGSANQPARPILDKVMRNSEEAAIDAMQEEFNRRFD